MKVLAIVFYVLFVIFLVLRILLEKQEDNSEKTKSSPSGFCSLLMVVSFSVALLFTMLCFENLF